MSIPMNRRQVPCCENDSYSDEEMSQQRAGRGGPERVDSPGLCAS